MSKRLLFGFIGSLMVLEGIAVVAAVLLQPLLV
jgi:hypothetical protein